MLQSSYVLWRIAAPVSRMGWSGCGRSRLSADTLGIIGPVEEPPPVRCRPDITAAECAVTTKSLLRESREWAADYAAQVPAACGEQKL